MCGLNGTSLKASNATGELECPVEDLISLLPQNISKQNDSKCFEKVARKQN